MQHVFKTQAYRVGGNYKRYSKFHSLQVALDMQEFGLVKVRDM